MYVNTLFRNNGRHDRIATVVAALTRDILWPRALNFVFCSYVIFVSSVHVIMTFTFFFVRDWLKNVVCERSDLKQVSPPLQFLSCYLTITTKININTSRGSTIAVPIIPYLCTTVLLLKFTQEKHHRNGRTHSFFFIQQCWTIVFLVYCVLLTLTHRKQKYSY